jgi:hypothetical protein
MVVTGPVLNVVNRGFHPRREARPADWPLPNLPITAGCGPACSEAEFIICQVKSRQYREG